MRASKLLWLVIACVRICFAAADSEVINLERDAAAVSLPSNDAEWQEQQRFFQENGYLWIRDFFTPEQVLILQDWAHEMNRAAESYLALQTSLRPSLLNASPLPLVVVPERANPLQVCRVEDMMTCYPEFHDFIAVSLTPFIGELLNEPYISFKDKLNFKWPGGGAFLAHQDFPAYEGFAPREHVTVMVSIDFATLENGCLHVAKNWRKTFDGCPDIDATSLKSGRAVLPYITGGAAHGSIHPDYVEKISWLALKTSPRDLVLINSFVPHYSEPNRSNCSRRAMFLTYNRLSEGAHRSAYYHAKRSDPENPVFHIGTPTNARTK